jgi:putative endonuclease
LQSINHNKRYIGYTSNFLRRLGEHNNSKGKFTSKYKPFRLLFRRSFPDKTRAIKYEKFLKKMKGGNKFYSEISKFNKGS